MNEENPINAIMNADSIAFFGASNNPTTMGTIQCMNLLNGDYRGKVYPVHPKEEQVLGLKAYKNVKEIPDVPQLAVLVLPTGIVPEIMSQCAKKGIKRAIIISGGFKEKGEKGKALELKLKDITNQYGLRFIGPNCIGVINSTKNMNVTFFPYHLGEGPLGLVSQSGTYVTQSLPYLERMGMRYSKAMSLGNEADIDLVDGINYLGDDPQTKAIAVYIEVIRRGRDFIETAKRVSLKKPIVAYYVGGTEAGARAGMSHTGAIGGSDEIHTAVFKQCGIIRAPTVEALYDWAWALATQPLPKGRRVGIVSHSGGPVTSMADACSRAGLDVPRLSSATQEKLAPYVPATGSTANPVDLTFSMSPDVMANVIPNILYESGEVDAVLVHGIMLSGFMRGMKGKTNTANLVIDRETVKKLAQSFHEKLVELSQNKGCPVLTSSFGDREDEAVDFIVRNNIPCYPAPERAVHALKAMVVYSEWIRGTNAK